MDNMNVNHVDNGLGQDGVGIAPMVNLKDRAYWKGMFALTKWDFTREDGSIDTKSQTLAEADMANGMSFEALKDKYGVFLKSNENIGENLLLNTGINNLWNALAGNAVTTYSNANAQIGVGDSSTAAAATQTGLQAATNILWVGMDATYPTAGSSQQIVFRSTFTSAQANYVWAEFCCRNGATAAISLNRLVSAQGTKTAGQTWQVTLTITLS